MSASTLDSTDTSTHTIEGVDLDAVPTCTMPDEECAGDHGPAVARALFDHQCNHRQHVLMCQPCYDLAVTSLNLLAQLDCSECGHVYVCMLSHHVTLSLL